MQKILKQSYQPLTFERFFAVYMMWYDDELVKKFHGEVFPGLLTRELGEVKEGQSNPNYGFSNAPSQSSESEL